MTITSSIQQCSQYVNLKNQHIVQFENFELLKILGNLYIKRDEVEISKNMACKKALNYLKAAGVNTDSYEFGSIRIVSAGFPVTQANRYWKISLRKYIKGVPSVDESITVNISVLKGDLLSIFNFNLGVKDVKKIPLMNAEIIYKTARKAILGALSIRHPKTEFNSYGHPAMELRLLNGNKLIWHVSLLFVHADRRRFIGSTDVDAYSGATNIVQINAVAPAPEGFDIGKIDKNNNYYAYTVCKCKEILLFTSGNAVPVKRINADTGPLFHAMISELLSPGVKRVSLISVDYIIRVVSVDGKVVEFPVDAKSGIIKSPASREFTMGGASKEFIGLKAVYESTEDGLK